jgi:hypothetical protein
MKCRCGKGDLTHVYFKEQGFDLVCFDCYAAAYPYALLTSQDLVYTFAAWDEYCREDTLCLTMFMDWLGANGYPVNFNYPEGGPDS